MWYWLSHVHVKASWVEPVFSWACVSATGILSPSTPLGYMWGFGVCPKGAASELLDGTLKLRYCTTLFTTRFPPWSSPRVGNGDSKRQSDTPVHLLDESSVTGRRVRQSRGDGKDCAPRPPLERGARWACLAIFFLVLGLDEVCSWGSLEPAFGGNRLGVPAGQSSRRGWRTGASPF